MNLSLSFPTQRYYRVGVSVFFFLQGLTFATWASRIPDIKNFLGLTDAGLGAVLFALPAGQLTAMGLSGYLVGRFGSRKILSIGALLYPAVLVLLGTVTTVWQLTIGLFLFGICGNLCNISANTQAIGVERIYRRSIMASFHGLWSLAGFLGGLISSFMVADHIAPLTHFCIIYIVAFVGILSARPYMLPRDAHQGKRTTGKFFVRPDSYIVKLGLIAFACMICEGTMFDWSGIYFEKVVEAPVELTRLGYVAFMSTMAGGRFAADWLVTKFGVTRILQTSGIIIVSGMSLAVAIPTITFATIGFLMIGIGVSSVVPLVYSLAGKSKKMLPSLALASVASIGFLGFLIGPPIIGFIAEALSLQWSFILVALLGLGTTVLAAKIGTQGE
jgi:MFS family permease